MNERALTTLEHAINYLLESASSHEDINAACDILYAAHKSLGPTGQLTPEDAAIDILTHAICYCDEMKALQIRRLDATCYEAASNILDTRLHQIVEGR